LPSLPLPHPFLAADHVLIRPWTEGDLPWVVAATDDAAIARWSHLPAPFDAAAVRAWFDAMPSEREQGTALRMLIAEAGDGARLGAIALDHFDWAAQTAEIGYWVAEPARGRGVASAAVALLTDWAFAELGLAEIVALLDADNAPSQRTLERCGFLLDEASRGDVQLRYVRLPRLASRSS
jgi:RimJ/RimL family protein N-acetyltransferase